MTTTPVSETTYNQVSSFHKDFVELMEKYNVYFDIDPGRLSVNFVPNRSLEGSIRITRDFEAPFLEKVKDCMKGYK